MSEVSSELVKTEVEHREPQVADTEASGSATENSETTKDNNTAKDSAQMDGNSIEHQHNVTVVAKPDNVDDDDQTTKCSTNMNTMLIDVGQQPEDHNNAGDASQKNDSQVDQTKTSDVIDSTNKENSAETSEELSEDKVKDISNSEKSTGKEPISAIGNAPLPTTTTTSASTTTTTTTVETQEVSSTRNDDPPKSVRSSSRRPSYNSGRGYAGGYQNYGLTYLPYKSNFEPSENARRKADEFFKTLKL